MLSLLLLQILVCAYLLFLIMCVEISILPKAIKAIGLLVVGCWVRAIVIGCISCEDE